MPLYFEEDIVRIEGLSAVEEAEPLLQWYQEHPKGQVDLGACEHVHAAVLQVLHVAAPRVIAWPAAELSDWLKPLLEQAQGKA